MSTARLSLRPRRWPLVVAVIVVVLAIAFSVASGFWIDLLWYREVDLSAVFWTTLRAKFLLGLTFGLAFLALLGANLWFVRRIRPEIRVLTPEQEAIERVRDQFEPILRWAVPAGAVVLALLVGIGASRQWQTFLLWRYSSGVTFGSPEPLFHRDPAFYVFSLPWLRFVQGWLFSSLVGVTFLVAIGHFLYGGIRPQAPAFADKVTPQVRAHLSVLLGLIMVTKAWGYWLGRFDLLTSKRGVVEGASFTDVKAQLPALTFLVIVALICAVLFFLNIRVRLWSLPIIAVGLLAVVSILLGAAYPAFVQRFRVDPQEFQREQPYIEDNIAGTRRAFDLDRVEVSQRSVSPIVTARALEDNPGTVGNVRLWRPDVLKQNLQSTQRIRQYYEFNDVDVDRYDQSGERRVLMVAGREVVQSGIPGGGATWQNQHLVYTHGYGAVASQVNTASPEGAPLLTLRDIPPVGEPVVERPQVYFGEYPDAADYLPFVITNTGTPELDYEGASITEDERYSYDGDGGIPMGNFLQRALFAWRFRDVNLLISGQIDSASRIMINRAIELRATIPAPFLTFDGDPYLALVDGRQVWIWDAYTMTDQYPYSEAIDLEDATGVLGGSVNYIRNAVKVTVDAYDGTLTYYADLSDPIIAVWARAFPGMFTSIQEAPASLRGHFRYPENLFQVQATQFGNYHVTEPEVFYQKQDFWEVPTDPTIATSAALGIGPEKLHPNYLLMSLPGEDALSFQLVTPFVPEGRQNMVAWMAASSDPDEYGRTVSYTFPSGQNIDGPSLVFSRINQDPTFSAERTLLGRGGSSVLFGDLLTIPIEDSIVYVLPVYVQANQEASVPEVKRVVAVSGDKVGVALTLGDALDQVVGGAVQEPDGGQPEGSVQERIVALVQQALDHFEAAQQALTQGNLATYQAEIEAAQQAVEEANRLAERAGEEPPTVPTGSATASPSVEPSGSPSPGD